MYLINSYKFGGGAAPSHVFLADNYSLTTIFSLYKESTTATNCIRVRRSSDNAEQDIGFNANNLDTASLLTFIGVNDGRIVKWYNQGSNAATDDLIQSTGSLQPYIVLGGVLYEDLSLKPTINFTNNSLNANLAYFNNKSFGASIVVLRNDTTATRRDIFSFKTSGVTARFFSTFNLPTSHRSSIYTRRLNGDSVSVLTTGANYTAGDIVRTDIIDWFNADAFIRENGTQVASNLSHGTAGSTSSTNSSGAGLGNIESVTSVDRISLWIISNTDIATYIPNIETDINNRYAIY
jgi:hypothetical protein